MKAEQEGKRMGRRNEWKDFMEDRTGHKAKWRSMLKIKEYGRKKEKGVENEQIGGNNRR